MEIENNFLNNFDDLLDDPQVDPVNADPDPLQDPDPNIDPDPDPEPDPDNDDEKPDFSDNALYSFLQERGIKDPSKLPMFSDENQETPDEVDFGSLTKEEQLDILRQVTDPGLTQDEIQTINFLRSNNTTLSQVIDYYSQKRLEDYLAEHPEDAHKKVYSVDDYTDEDLFLNDLKNRYPDFTDEELAAELESAKENEELFKKKADIIRQTYKANEDQAEELRIEQEKQQVEDLRNNLSEAVSKFNEIQLDYADETSGSLVIDDSDKQQIMSYILDQDADGNSEFVKDLQNPDRLIEIAWFSVKGAEILSQLSQYWKGLLSEERSKNNKLQAKLDKLGKTSVTTTKTETEKQNTQESV